MSRKVAEKLRFKYAPVEPFVFRQIDIGLLAIPVSELNLQPDEHIIEDEFGRFVVVKDGNNASND
jgi:hypothetical protein